MVIQSLLCQCVELTGSGIAHDLSIPGVGFKLEKPISKLSKLLGVELSYLLLNRFQSTHIIPLVCI